MCVSNDAVEFQCRFPLEPSQAFLRGGLTAFDFCGAKLSCCPSKTRCDSCVIKHGVTVCLEYYTQRDSLPCMIRV